MIFLKNIILILLLTIELFSTTCCDGSSSTSTGRGTCSHHGGVCSGNSGYTPPVLSPSIPSNLSIHCENAQDIKLSWNDTSDSYFYKVYASSSCNNSSYSYLDTVYNNSYSTSLFDTCNVCFKIKSCNYSSCSNYSNSIHTTLSPSIPSNLSIHYENGQDIKLSWDDTSDSYFYKIYASSSCNNSSYSYLDTVYNNSYSTSLFDSSNVCFKIKSCNYSSCSNYSNSIHINNIRNNSTIFDGAGSIISSKEQGAGKNFDIAKMHPHFGAGSTVVFQWLYDKDTCSQLDILSEYDIGDVIIRSKAWNKGFMEKSIRVRLDEGIPITIKRENNNLWTTFAVSTTKPLNYGNKIVVKCKTSDDIFKVGIRTEISKDLVNVNNDYFWTGTASIISNANRYFHAPYGITTDLAVTFKKMNSLTSFQWLRQKSCKKLKISSNKNYSIDSIYIKKWDSESWGNSKCNSLPCTLTPTSDNYYIIKVESNSHDIEFKVLKAECIRN